MEETANFKAQITNQRAKLILVIGFLAVVLAGEALVVWNWYRQSKTPIASEERLMLKQTEFEKLWQQLKEKTVTVETGTEIRYGEEVGKLEPFD